MSRGDVMSEEVKYSIVIPTYNREASIKKSIESCLTYTDEIIEVIVVDDGSVDNTRQIVESIEDPRVTYIYQKNSGASAARNNGVNVSKGKYICFLDSDDEYTENRLKTTSEYFSELDDGLVLCCRVLFKNENFKRIKPALVYNDSLDITEYIYCKNGFFATPAITVSSALAKRVSWDESLGYGDDTDYVLKLYKYASRFKMIDAVDVIVDDSSTDNRLSLKKDSTSLIEWYDKHRVLLTKKSNLAFLARHLSFHDFWNRPFYYSLVLIQAAIHKALSPMDVAKCFVRSALPTSWYKKLL